MPHQDTEPRVRQTVDGGSTKPGAQAPIERAGRAPTLHMAQRGHAEVEAELVMVLGEVPRHRGGIVSGPFSHDTDRVRLATLVRFAELVRDRPRLHLGLRNDDDFCAAGQAGHERQVPTIASHHLDKECPLV